MKLQKLISKLFFITFLLLVSANSFAETKWEVASVFLGRSEDSDFQKDVERNLEELKKIKTSTSLTISTFRESPEGTNNRNKLLPFLKKAFKDPKSKKMLVMYGHGEGPRGMRDLDTKELKELLDSSGLKFDLVWFDSCFLSNLEFLFEIRKNSEYFIASQEAEFSTGLPFESLNELPNYSDSKEAASVLAKSFIDSYSYLKAGSQTDAVATSSATISVIDAKELESFVTSFKILPQILAKLSESDKSALAKKMMKKFSMDNPKLMDLGRFLIELRLLIKDQKMDQELTKLIRLLNIESVKKLRSNPRIRIMAPTENAQMVFGFNKWENGAKKEYSDNPLFQEIINTKTFISGPKNKEWPVKKFENKSTMVSPFAPGVNSFEYYFLSADGKKVLTQPESITRTLDVVESPMTKKAPGAFLVYSAYTQQIGAKAEKYTGVTLMTFQAAPSMDYFDSAFNQLVNWLEL